MYFVQNHLYSYRNSITILIIFDLFILIIEPDFHSGHRIVLPGRLGQSHYGAGKLCDSSCGKS